MRDSNCVNPILHLIPFANSIIGEAIGTPSPDRPFLYVHIALLMIKGVDDQGNNTLNSSYHLGKSLYLFIYLMVSGKVTIDILYLLVYPPKQFS